MSDSAAPPLVTIIMPARNSAATIAQSLDCLLAQTEPRWRALIIDDGSRDETGAIIDAYAAADPRFEKLAGPSQGVSAARNVAMPLATGRWLHFLDSDDWVVPHFYATMLAHMDAVPGCAAGYSGYQRVMPDGGTSWTFYEPKIAVNAMECFARNCALHCAGLLLRRDAVEKVGYFDPSLKICEDMDLYQRVARLGGAWVGVAEPLAFYRVNAGSLSRDHAQLQKDLRTVATRGFCPDPRLGGLDVAYPNGADDPGGAVDEACAITGMWVAVQYCGPDPGHAFDVALFRALPKFGPDWPYHPKIMIEGLMVGERVTADKLAAMWPRIGHGLTRLIAAFGQAWNDPAAAHALQRAFEEKLMDFDDMAGLRTLTLTRGLRMDIYRPAPVELPAGVERVYAHLVRGQQFRAVKIFEVTGYVSRVQWARLILAACRDDGQTPRRVVAGLRLSVLVHEMLAMLTAPLTLLGARSHA